MLLFISLNQYIYTYISYICVCVSNLIGIKIHINALNLYMSWKNNILLLCQNLTCDITNV